MSETNDANEQRMRAIRVHSREGTRAMVCEKVAIPRPASGEALVRVHAAGITPTEFTWNSTFVRRDGKERLPIVPGFEFSGTVAALGQGVSDFAVGEEVYGLLDFWRDGAAADYVVVDAAYLALKPGSIDHVRAAAIPLSGLTAWQALFDHGNLKPGERVLVHGAAGGVGSYAVQLAHHRGAHVRATASAGRETYQRDLGADEVIDYPGERFEERVGKVDLVLDTVGGETLERSWSVVRAGGTLVTIVGDVSDDRAKATGIRAVSMLVEPHRSELIEIARQVDTGALRSMVDATFPLESAREAYERGSAGLLRGMTVLTLLPRGSEASLASISRKSSEASRLDPGGVRTRGPVP